MPNSYLAMAGKPVTNISVQGRASALPRTEWHCTQKQASRAKLIQRNMYLQITVGVHALQQNVQVHFQKGSKLTGEGVTRSLKATTSLGSVAK